MTTKTKESKIKGKKNDNRNIYNLPKGRLTEYWDMFPDPVIKIINMRAVLR